MSWRQNVCQKVTLLRITHLTTLFSDWEIMLGHLQCIQQIWSMVIWKSGYRSPHDHKPLETIFKKPLNKAPARLQRMMMMFQRYRFGVTYHKGTSLYLADTLSRATLNNPVTATVTGFEVFRLELEGDDNRPNPHLKPDTETMIRMQVKTDPVMSQLSSCIIQGWPDQRSDVSEETLAYWSYRDELSIQNGIIYRGTQIVVPPSMHGDMLRKIHVNHFGADSNIRITRSIVLARDACNDQRQYGSSVYLSIYKYPCRGESPSRKLVKEKVQSSRVLSIYRNKTCVGAG